MIPLTVPLFFLILPHILSAVLLRVLLFPFQLHGPEIWDTEMELALCCRQNCCLCTDKCHTWWYCCSLAYLAHALIPGSLAFLHETIGQITICSLNTYGLSSIWIASFFPAKIANIIAFHTFGILCASLVFPSQAKESPKRGHLQ